MSRRNLMEIWKDIQDYEGIYQVSNLGRVRSLMFRGKERVLVMASHDNGNGYRYITLFKDKKRKNHYIHRLVANAFVENPKNHGYVNHIDYNKTNNNSDNLEWCSQKENVMHSAGRMRHPKSTTHAKSGEKGIYFNTKTNRYRVVINRKEYPSCKTFEEAVNFRNEIIRTVRG